MHPIIYDVSVSLDGYISGVNGDISQFDQEGAVVDDYFDRLRSYHMAIMGRHTYEFGYGFGLKAGDNPYPNMSCHIFSSQLHLPKDSEVHAHKVLTRDAVEALRQSASGPVYLCGGGTFAGALLTLGLIDRLRLKIAPILLGGGVPLFASGITPRRLKRIDLKTYSSGYVYQEFSLTPQS
ncbi:MAG: dihydrofolate reductase family protein [Pseudomonadota bacterium]